MINRIALIGLGYIGKIHLKLLTENPEWIVSGIYDLDQKLTRELAEQYKVKACASIEEAIESADAVNILTPVNTHFEIARKAIIAGKHVYMEKPLTSSLKEAKQLQLLVNEAGIYFQTSHSERLNPAFTAALPYLDNPKFIEVHRLSTYKPRGTDVSVVQDLMLHDIDLVLSIVKGNIKRISASGTPLVSTGNDIVNARIEFDNGTVANLTTNRLAFKNTRKFRVFTEKNFVSINLFDKITEVVKIKDATSHKTDNLLIETSPLKPKKEIVFEHPIILPTNAINSELVAFYQGINTGKRPKISIADSIRIMELACEIEEKISA